jgi:hypothetical protein
MFGNGFLASWNDVEPAVEDEYRRWHRTEHMPERLAIPGFTLGRRYVDSAAPANRYLTVYEARDIGTFASDVYRARLATPTSETVRMSLQMKNFVRRICRTVASEGTAIGGAAAVFRLEIAARSFQKLVQGLCAVDGTVSAHLGEVDQEMSGLRSDRLQSHMAATGILSFNSVLLVEADSRDAAIERLPAWESIIAADANIAVGQIYDLALLFRPLYE